MKQQKVCERVIICLLLLSGLSFAQVTVAPLCSPRCQFFDSNGAPLAGGKVYTYSAASTNPQTTYKNSASDPAGQVQNSNPVILDAGGFGDIWLTSSAYKIVVTDYAGVQQYTVDYLTAQPKTGDSSYLKIDGSNFPFSQNLTLLGAQGTATASANYPSYTFEIDGSYWNSAAAAKDRWILQDVLGTGANPASTLNISHTGSSGMSALGLPAVIINSELVSNSPRMTWTGYGGMNASGSSIHAFSSTVLNQITLDKPITVTRVQATLLFAEAGCSSPGGITVTDGTTVAANLTFSNGTFAYDSGAISINYAAAATLKIQTLATAAAGCSAYPVSQTTVEYKMQ